MRQFLVDAFANQPFKGNPACVVEPLDAWPDDTFLQALAMENNQAETAYLLKTDDPARFGLRWFTPAMEVRLCGHATLASAHSLFVELGNDSDVLTFDTLSGPLHVRRLATRLEMDFPGYMPQAVAIPDEIERAAGIRPRAVFAGPALIAQFTTEAEVRNLKPDLRALPAYMGSVYDDRHLVVTAPADPGKPYDAVSRLFAPDMGIDEDPATGSMHCMLGPLYALQLGKPVIDFYQAHPRRGADIQAEVRGDRVLLRGQALTVARSRLNL
jgi:PhzF family phenazine biosynthesis protein